MYSLIIITIRILRLFSVKTSTLPIKTTTARNDEPNKNKVFYILKKAF